MKTRFLLLFFLLSSMIKAQTIEVSGPQTGTWDADTVFIAGDVKVLDSLSISPGTKVIFNGYYSIEVTKNASLKAVGTESDSIVFTVMDTTYFHVFNSGRGGWNGIKLDKAGASRFEYCRLQYGKAALDEDQDGGALRVFSCKDVEISHSTLFCNFSREHGGALNAEWSKVSIRDCDVCNNMTYTGIDTVYFMYGGGLRFINCEVDITGTDFRNNNGQNAIGGALSLDSCAVNIDRCKFEYNYGINGGGLYLIRSNDWECSISNSLFANNSSGHFGGGLAICDSSPSISNLTVVNNHSYGVNCGGIFFYQYSSPIVCNCIVYGNTNDALLEEPVQMWAWTFDDDAPEFHNCLVQYGLENISNHEHITVYERCLDEDPLFVNPELGDFHLNATSPCIDAGVPLETEGFDLDGLWRVCGNGTDIGAYEYSGLGVQENTQSKALIRIVGNPVTASSYAEIELENAAALTAKVYSMDGKLMIEHRLGQAAKGVNRVGIGALFQSLASGTYLLVLSAENQTFVGKVVH